MKHTGNTVYFRETEYCWSYTKSYITAAFSKIESKEAK